MGSFFTQRVHWGRLHIAGKTAEKGGCTATESDGFILYVNSRFSPLFAPISRKSYLEHGFVSYLLQPLNEIEQMLLCRTDNSNSLMRNILL